MMSLKVAIRALRARSKMASDATRFHPIPPCCDGAAPLFPQNLPQICSLAATGGARPTGNIGSWPKGCRFEPYLGSQFVLLETPRQTILSTMVRPVLDECAYR